MGKTEHISKRQNLVFLSVSLFLVWTWMYFSAIKDVNNDRGLLTISGFIILTSFLLSIFLSKKKIIAFLITFFYFGILGFFMMLMIFSLGVFDWIGTIFTLLLLGASIFLIVRRLIVFPNNRIAFLIILCLPIPIVAIINLSFYDSTFKHKFGIAFPIAIYLSLLFISISILCRKK
jgi:hypothetical protein